MLKENFNHLTESIKADIPSLWNCLYEETPYRLRAGIWDVEVKTSTPESKHLYEVLVKVVGSVSEVEVGSLIRFRQEGVLEWVPTLVK